ncbi:MAG: molybdopterin-guanine dinucleotide biosynthesis protein MobB [Hyphomicrobium sp.]
MQLLDLDRINNAKRATSTRRIDLKSSRLLVASGVAPKAGDLVLARVIRTGHHDGVEELSGRRNTLYAGDEILVCYGNRYAPDQFEAIVPESLAPCHLVAAGGLAGRALSWHTSMRSPTEIAPVGLVAGQDARVLNIRDFRVPMVAANLNIPVIFSVGTSMNSGKTTTAARVIHGLKLAGLKVGAAKITGTSAGKDTWLMRDSGADLVLDFNDAGFATTYKESIADVEDGAFRIMGHLQAKNCDVAVVEIADGLLQGETHELLQRPSIRKAASAVLFSSVDSMGAVGGARWLRDLGYHVPALTGVMTNSPLAAREASEATGLPVMTLAALQDPQLILPLFPFATRAHRARVLGEVVDAALCA